MQNKGKGGKRMYTDKYRRFQAFKESVQNAMGNTHQGCMVCCGGGRMEKVKKVLLVLAEYNLNLTSIRTEMQTLVAGFDFVENWRERTSTSDTDCLVHFNLFFMACYKHFQ